MACFGWAGGVFGAGRFDAGFLLAAAESGGFCLGGRRFWPCCWCLFRWRWIFWQLRRMDFCWGAAVSALDDLALDFLVAAENGEFWLGG